jgi:hypothetical protein
MALGTLQSSTAIVVNPHGEEENFYLNIKEESKKKSEPENSP